MHLYPNLYLRLEVSVCTPAMRSAPNQQTQNSPSSTQDMYWIPTIGDRVVCDGRRPLRSGAYEDDCDLSGEIVAEDESAFEFYVDPQDGTHPMFTNINQMQRASDGATPNLLFMLRKLIRHWGPITASVNMNIFLEHRVRCACSATLREILKIRSIRVRGKRPREEVTNMTDKYIATLRAATAVVSDNAHTNEAIMSGIYFFPRAIYHSAIMSGRYPSLLRLSQIIEYVNECRDVLTNEINGIETEENSDKLKKCCGVCFNKIPETSVLKHIGNCTFEACTRCWLEVRSRNQERCPQCRQVLGADLVHTFNDSDWRDAPSSEIR